MQSPRFAPVRSCEGTPPPAIQTQLSTGVRSQTGSQSDHTPSEVMSRKAAIIRAPDPVLAASFFEVGQVLSAFGRLPGCRVSAACIHFQTCIAKPPSMLLNGNTISQAQRPVVPLTVWTCCVFASFGQKSEPLKFAQMIKGRTIIFRIDVKATVEKNESQSKT
jgi:hypothetical protein